MIYNDFKTYPSRQVSVAIQQSFDFVYKFTSNPANLPLWAQGLSRSTLRPSGDVWIADSPMGEVKVKFSPSNPWGILDHEVILPSGEKNHNPFRVIPNGDGCELIFTVFQRPNKTANDLEQDALQVEKDLKMLRSLMETAN